MRLGACVHFLQDAGWAVDTGDFVEVWEIC